MRFPFGGVAPEGRMRSIGAHLLHDTGLPLGKGYMATRFVGDELDLNLAALAPGLIIVIVVVVGRGGTLPLDATGVGAGSN